jgi:hypothetical protein
MDGIVKMLKTRIVTIGVVMLMLIAAGIGCSSTTTHTDTSAGISGSAQPDRVVLGRSAIESAYPEFKDFENQESSAGQSVKSEADDGDYYFAYIVLGSGLPIAEATCFRVDQGGRVFMIGVFPDPVDSYVGYRDVDPRNCRGIK